MRTQLDPATIIQTTMEPKTPSALSTRDHESLKKSSQDFEAIFIQSMIKAMRKTVPEGTLFPKSNGEKLYEEMLDSELASHMASQQSLGLAEQIYQSMERQLAPEDKKA
ncbi:rod-binding protein [Desulfogranum mediterraneum]|uniref:rod-binding protein n=1 Tax=Desulfogranum mediterraneum TaxID=160661 RepID=UPI00041BCA3F|nr:rod-binding protein [Desulfogranum mediterraneum]